METLPLAASSSTNKLETRGRLDLAGPLAPILALVGCALFGAGVLPIPDNAYQFYLAGRVLDGARLYIDVAAADMHPPLFTWLAMVVEALARVFRTSGLTLYPSFVAAAAAASLYAVWRIGPRSGFVLVILVLALLPLPGTSFGQGEHLAVIFSLPYLFGAAAAADGREFTRRTSIALALAAALGLGMKPHFALVWVAVETYVARSRGIRSFLRTESVVIGVLFVLYVIATALLTPEFFHLLRWLLELYPRYAATPFTQVLFDKRALLLAAGIVAGRTVNRDAVWRRISDVLSIAALAMYAALLLQGKGWEYHWYPVNALAVVLCGLAVRPHVVRFPVLVPALAAAAVLWMNAQVNHTTEVVLGPSHIVSKLVVVTERFAKGGTIVVLDHQMEVAFPLVNLTGVRWASPYAHLWMIPAMYPDAWAGKTPFHYRDAGKWRALEQQMFDRLWESIQREDPNIMIVELPMDNGFDMRAYFSTDPRFRDRFERSPVLARIGVDYMIYGRPAVRRQ